MAATFLDSHDDDDQLLLDDVNTEAGSRCWKCHGTGRLQTDPIAWLNGSVHNAPMGLTPDDLQLEDAPLLHDDHIGHLTVKEFHCHTTPVDGDNGHALKTLCLVAICCLIFMVMEIIGGYIAGSLAVMTDAAHLLSDVIGFLVSILALWIGKRPKTQRMTFGFYRVEVLGAFISVLIVWMLAGIFCFIAIDRLIHNEIAIDAGIMIMVAAFGVFINIIMGAILHGKCFGPSHQNGISHHGHSHSDNLNVRAAAAHVIGDLLQSVGVLVAAIVVKVYPQAGIVDPICTILFSVIVVAVTFRVARDSFLVLAEASPHVDKGALAAALRAIPGVHQVHSLHVWCLAPGKDAVAVHVAVGENCDRDGILRDATSIVRRRMNAIACAIQVEEYDHEQMSLCLDCQQ